MKYLIFAFAFIIGNLAATTSLWGQNEGTAITIGNRYSIHSDILEEDRTFYVALPESYARSKDYRRYPVVYILDGNWYFTSFAGAVRQLSADVSPHIPEMIVVAVSNDGQRVRDASPSHSLIGYEGMEDQNYATSGGGDAFLDYLEKELIPHIEATYATSDYRVLTGYSFNGLAALNSLFSREDLFGGYIIIDPSQWWDDFLMYRRAADVFGTQTFTQKALFLATQNESYPVQHFPTAKDSTNIADILKATNPRGLHWTHKRYEGENHHTMQLVAFMDGLKHIFTGHKPTLETLYMAPEKLTAQYKALSKRLGTRIAPKEGAIDFMGHNLMSYLKRPDADKALVHFRMNAANYPGSVNAWVSLGAALKSTGETEEALEAYQQALALKPESESLKAAVAALMDAN